MLVARHCVYYKRKQYLIKLRVPAIVFGLVVNLIVKRFSAESTFAGELIELNSIAMVLDSAPAANRFDKLMSWEYTNCLYLLQVLVFLAPRGVACLL